ncbi:WD40/YVTN/BNR-like repeat-containing protein [Zavarzinia sp.]|uniref:WD40/YVTN/BNR-like repeat-containing protein n=1 Tax=Zavarzinia sp. TaxID=2027920 RepID=UPI003BB80FDA
MGSRIGGIGIGLVASLGGLLMAAGAAMAGAGPALDTVRQGTTHEAIYCLSENGNERLAAGVPNLLFTSSDAGQTWQRVTEVNSTSAYLGCALKNDVALVVGQQGVMLRRDAKGWAKIDGGTDARLFSVDANDAGRAIAVGAFGTILVSSDTGRSWKKIDFDWSRTNDQGFEPHLYSASIATDGTMTVVGEFELIMRSKDGGATWDVTHIGTASLFDLKIEKSGTGYAVGQDGKVLRTRDGGATWDTVDSGSKANLLGIARGEDGKTLITGMRTMLVATDEATKLVPLVAGDVATTWYQPAIAAKGSGWIVGGHTGRIVRVGQN